MTAKIHLRNLKVETLIGLRAHERVQKQPLIFHLSAEIDLSNFEQKDDLEATVDYRALADTVYNCVKDSSYHLLERLTYNLAQHLLQTFGLLSIWIQVEKPHALKNLAEVSFEYFLKACEK